MSPSFTTSISQHLWQSRYRNANSGPGEVSIDDTWTRVAEAIASVETHDRGRWCERFHALLEDFKFLPGGRILAGAGTSRQVTLFNCFVMGTIPDSLPGILDALKEGGEETTKRIASLVGRYEDDLADRLRSSDRGDGGWLSSPPPRTTMVFPSADRGFQLVVLTQVLSSALSQVAPPNLAMVAGAALVLSAVTLAAGYLPARRAAKVEPATALRCE